MDMARAMLVLAGCVTVGIACGTVDRETSRAWLEPGVEAGDHPQLDALKGPGAHAAYGSTGTAATGATYGAGTAESGSDRGAHDSTGGSTGPGASTSETTEGGTDDGFDAAEDQELTLDPFVPGCIGFFSDPLCAQVEQTLPDACVGNGTVVIDYYFADFGDVCFGPSELPDSKRFDCDALCIPEGEAGCFDALGNPVACGACVVEEIDCAGESVEAAKCECTDDSPAGKPHQEVLDEGDDPFQAGALCRYTDATCGTEDRLGPIDHCEGGQGLDGVLREYTLSDADCEEPTSWAEDCSIVCKSHEGCDQEQDQFCDGYCRTQAITPSCDDATSIEGARCECEPCSNYLQPCETDDDCCQTSHVANLHCYDDPDDEPYDKYCAS